MVQFGTLMLRGWRLVALAGHYSGIQSTFDRETNGVLRYHSVGGGFYDNVSPEQFRRDVAYLDEHYEIVDLPAVLDPSETGQVALTFDDGYRDFFFNVRPVLHEYDVPATVFVIADAIDDPSFDHNDADDYSYMQRDELETLLEDDLVTVGNHTLSHPVLPELSSAELEREIVGAKRRLESVLDTEIERFCYPYGKFDERTVDLVRESHDFAVGGRGRRECITPETDPAYVPRVEGTNPLWEVSWDLSPASTFVGSRLDRFVGDAPAPGPEPDEPERPTAVVESSEQRERERAR